MVVRLGTGPMLDVSTMRSQLDLFSRDARGNVGMLFGIAAIPIMIATGAAVDYSRASSLLSDLQSGTDATTLALCQTNANTAVADLRTRAQTAMANYYKAGTVTIVDVQTITNPRTVTLKTKAVYPTAFMQLVQRPTIEISASATCSSPETFFEIALVLDTTGSMAYTGGTQTKMEAAKTAATNFVNYMYSQGALPGHLRMSLVPFAASVALPSSLWSSSWLDQNGISPIHWRYVTKASDAGFTDRFDIYAQLKKSNSSWDWKGCVESPPFPYNTKDDAVSSGTPSSLIVPMFAPDEAANTKSNGSDDRTNANSYIDDGSSYSGSCDSDDSSVSKRMTQACKYNARNNPRSSKPGPNWHCTARALSTLGTAQATMLTEIAQLQPLGSTNIHEGFMWGWRTISPTSVFSSQSTPPVAYGTKQYKKIIVLMTDGENQWLSNSTTLGSNYSAYGYFNNADGSDATGSNSRFIPTRVNLNSDSDGRTAIDELLATSCTNAKTKNIEIYTIGFSTPTDPIDAQGLKLLSDCATASDYAFVANDATSLIAAFDKISKGIGALRITK